MVLRTACSRGSKAERYSGTWLCEHIKLLDPATPEARVSLRFSLSSFWKLFFFNPLYQKTQWRHGYEYGQETFDGVRWDEGRYELDDLQMPFRWAGLWVRHWRAWIGSCSRRWHRTAMQGPSIPPIPVSTREHFLVCLNRLCVCVCLRGISK